MGFDNRAAAEDREEGMGGGESVARVGERAMGVKTLPLVLHRINAIDGCYNWGNNMP